MVAGPEFGPEQGKNMIVVRALYVLKSASVSLRSFMAKKLDELGLKSSKANCDVWLRPAVKGSGKEYYEYVMLYVDDVMVASHQATKVMEDLGRGIKYKDDKIEAPDSYLSAQLAQKKLSNGLKCWCMPGDKYVNAAIKNVEEAINKKSLKIPNKVRTPMDGTFIPELDETPELDSTNVKFYQELIGILRWATELGRADILHEVSILSQYQVSPRQGYLHQLLHIFGYLKKKQR